LPEFYKLLTVRALCCYDVAVVDCECVYDIVECSWQWQWQWSHSTGTDETSHAAGTQPTMSDCYVSLVALLSRCITADQCTLLKLMCLVETCVAMGTAGNHSNGLKTCSNTVGLGTESPCDTLGMGNRDHNNTVRMEKGNF